MIIAKRNHLFISILNNKINKSSNFFFALTSWIHLLISGLYRLISYNHTLLLYIVPLFLKKVEEEYEGDLHSKNDGPNLRVC